MQKKSTESARRNRNTLVVRKSISLSTQESKWTKDKQIYRRPKEYDKVYLYVSSFIRLCCGITATSKVQRFATANVYFVITSHVGWCRLWLSSVGFLYSEIQTGRRAPLQDVSALWQREKSNGIASVGSKLLLLVAQITSIHILPAKVSHMAKPDVTEMRSYTPSTGRHCKSCGTGQELCSLFTWVAANGWEQ